QRKIVIVENLERRFDRDVIFLRLLVGEGAGQSALDGQVLLDGARPQNGEPARAALTAGAQPVARPILHRLPRRHRKILIERTRRLKAANVDARRLDHERRLAPEADIGELPLAGRRRTARGKPETQSSKQDVTTSDHGIPCSGNETGMRGRARATAMPNLSPPQETDSASSASGCKARSIRSTRSREQRHCAASRCGACARTPSSWKRRKSSASGASRGSTNSAEVEELIRIAARRQPS